MKNKPYHLNCSVDEIPDSALKDMSFSLKYEWYRQMRSNNQIAADSLIKMIKKINHELIKRFPEYKKRIRVL